MAGLIEGSERVGNLRVAYLIRSWPRLSQTFILNEVVALERLGVEVTVFSLTRAHDRVVQHRVAEVRASVHYVDEERAAHVIPAWQHVASAAGAPGRYLRAVRDAIGHPQLTGGYANGTTTDALRAALHVAAYLRAARRAGRPVHHVHAHFAHDPALVGLLVHRLTGVPFTFTAHARDLYQVPAGALAVRTRAARAVVVCSQANADYLHENLPRLGSPPVRVIRHGVDVHLFHPAAPADPAAPNNRPLVLSVGRLVDKKGFDDLLRACAQLVSEGVRFRCEVYGDGPLARELTALRDDLGLRGWVSFCGERRQHDLVPVFRRADVFALTPRVTATGDRDGIPNVIAEAMACGVPVVATTVGGVAEIVRHGETGLLAPPRRPDRFATELARLLTDERLRHRLGAAARRAVETELDGAASARALLDVFTPAPAGRERKVTMAW